MTMADESLQSEQETKKVDTEHEVNPEGIGTPGDTDSQVDEAEQSEETEEAAPAEADAAEGEDTEAAA